MANVTLSALIDKFLQESATTSDEKNTLREYLGLKTTDAVVFKSLTLTSPSANTSVLASTGFSLTGSSAVSLIDLAGTWNTTGTPTGIKLNVTDTASDAASLLMDLQVGGASKFKVLKGGQIVGNSGSSSTPAFAFSDSGSTGFYSPSSGVMYWGGDSRGIQWGFVSNGIMRIGYGGTLELCYGAADAGGDTFISRDSAATVQLGQDHATTATNQTIKAHDVTTGDAADLILKGGTSGGGGSNGSVRFGTHSAVGAETVTGYITIKDEGGTERKLAVIS